MSTIFPKWMNALPTVGAMGGFFGLVAVTFGTWYWATPDFFEVGYMPTQPGGGFNHQIHAGKLGLDCRYCHTKVEQSREANVPNAATCMGCHTEGRISLEYETPAITQKLQYVRDAYAADESIPFRRVHKLPDYVANFPHHVHINAGVSCFSCHGQITEMPEVYQANGLGMGWCLGCHRDPGKHLLEAENKDKTTQLKWVEQHLAERAADPSVDTKALAEQLLKQPPPQQCSACHY